MKKKIILAIVAVMSLCSFAAGLTACAKKEHEHNYEATVVAPTCTELGYTVHTCNECQHSYVDTYVVALGHSYTNYVSNGNATCTQDGTKTAVCDRDGCNERNTVTDEGTKLGHALGTPVWTWTGYESATATSTCANDASHVESVTATISSVVTTPATCTADGLRTYTAKVTFGGVEYTNEKSEAITKLGHDFAVEWSWTDYTSAMATFTCANDGTHVENVTATGEAITSVVTTPATCTADGVRTYTATVSFGGKTFTNEKNETLTKLGHSFNSYVSNGDATCTQDGTKTATCDHDGCNETHTVTVVDSKLGHALTHHDAKAPTCTEIGWGEYEDCSRCDYTTYVEIPAKGHSSDEWIIDEEATCTTDGAKHKVCTVCGQIFDERAIQKYGHNLIHTAAKAPTCTQIGWEAYDTCSRGDYTNYVEIPATGHTASEWIIYEEATCTAGGSKHKECTVCHVTLETEVINKLGHDLVHHNAKSPTCTEIGWEEYDTCSRCDYTTYDEIPANGHTASEWIIDIAATCTTGGSRHNVCTVCNEKLKTEVVDALGHSFTNYISNNDATTTADGTKTATCDRCDETDTVTDYGTMLGHTFGAPVWNWTGYTSATAKFTCQNCENEHVESVTATITSVVITPATCTTDGLRTYTAKVSFGGADHTDTKDETLTQLGHSYTAKWTWSGYTSATATLTCSRDKNHIVTETATGAAITNEITTPATCTEGGVRTYTAKVTFNGKEYTGTATEPVAATGHGNWNDNVCGNCGYDAGGSKGLNMVLNAEANTYSVNGKGDCTETAIVIPAIYNGLPVTAIGGWAFNGTDITSIEIPKGVTSIGNYAFNGCRALTSIEIPEGATKIEHHTFENCTALKSVVIPEGVESIGQSAFYNCQKLDGVILPKSLKTIGGFAFHSCYALTSLTIPENVTEIGTYIFYGCGELTGINIPKGVKIIPTGLFAYCSKLKDVTMHDEIEKISFSAFAYCYALESIKLSQALTAIESQGFLKCTALKRISLPDTVVLGENAFKGCTSLAQLIFNGGSIGENAFTDCTALERVTVKGGTIGAYAFANCTAISSLTLSEGVTSIGDYAFQNCSSITSIVIPESIVTIGENVFDGCTAIEYTTYNNARYLTIGTNVYAILVDVIDKKITSFNILETTKIISDYAFQNCASLTSIIIPANVTSIGKYAFSGCTGLTSITIGSGVTSIGNYAFENCMFTSIKIPENVTSIGEGLFSGCVNLQSVKLGDSVNYIGEYAFKGCSSLTSLILPDALTEIAAGTFEGCSSLESIVINNRVESIASYAFAECTALKSVTIGTGVTLIDTFAFQNCTALTSITIPNGVTSIGNFAFSGCTKLESVTILESATIGNGIESIGRCAFQYCSSLISISIPDSVTSIDENAFQYCTALESVTIGGGSIGRYAFYNCTALESVTLGNKVTTIGSDAFENCSSLISISIPDSVTSIGGYAFSGCTALESATIGKGITSIGTYAFNGCSSLISITLPNGLTSIGTYAFYNCSSLTSITIPKGVTSIGTYTFYDCSSLISITIPDSVTSIGTYAFYGCTALTSVTIGAGVTSISNYAFSECYNLVEVYNLSSLNIVQGASTFGGVARYALNVYTNEEGSSKLSTENDFIFYENGKTIYLVGYTGSETALTLPTLSDNKTYSIYQYAFKNCRSLTSIKIPDSVTSIGNYAFQYCSSLTSITIGNSVTEIGSNAFKNCSSLTSITIPDSVTSISNYAFNGCYKLVEVYNLSSLEIVQGASTFGGVARYALDVYTSKDTNTKLSTDANGYIFYENGETIYLIGYTGSETALTLPTRSDGKSYSIYQYAFNKRTAITSVIIPDCVTSIGNYAFSGCIALESATIGNGVTKIGDYAFSSSDSSYYCNALKTVTLGNGVKSIGEYAFSCCTALASVIIPDSVTTIGEWAFSGCSALTSIIIPDSVTSLGENAFSYCSALTSVTIGSGVTSISNYAFYDCTALTGIIIPDSVTSIGDYAFKGCSALTGIIIPDSVTSIGEKAFYDCTKLTSVTIGSKVESISNYAFQNCTSLTSITIPNGVTSIGNYAFSGCTKLASVTIGNGVTSIGEYAFQNCTSLTSITIPDCVTSIGNYAFSGCTALESATVNGGSIGEYAFSSSDSKYYCKVLKTVTLGSNVTLIGNYAFYGCSSITSITIPASVKSIGEKAFSGCSSLESVTLGNGVTEIGSNAFYDCTALTSITIPASVKSIGNYAFRGCTGLTEINYNATECADFSSSNHVYAYAGQKGTGITVTIGANVTKIPAYLFYPYSDSSRSPKITSVVFKEGSVCASIGNYAFAYCSSLESITIPAKVTNIGEYAFNGCSKLTSVYYGGTAEAWGSITISTGNDILTSEIIYYYSEAEPTADGNFWHYVDGEIVVWKKQTV